MPSKDDWERWHKLNSTKLFIMKSFYSFWYGYTDWTYHWKRKTWDCPGIGMGLTTDAVLSLMTPEERKPLLIHLDIL